MSAYKFKYENCLGREYDTKKRSITSVVFDVSRYGEYTYRIKFSRPVSEKRAIRKVESYLSKPLTEIYFNTVKDDLFFGPKTWNDAVNRKYLYRGQCLAGAIHLENVEIKNGMLSFSTEN